MNCTLLVRGRTVTCSFTIWLIMLNYYKSLGTKIKGKRGNRLGMLIIGPHNTNWIDKLSHILISGFIACNWYLLWICFICYCAVFNCFQIDSWAETWSKNSRMRWPKVFNSAFNQSFTVSYNSFIFYRMHLVLEFSSRPNDNPVLKFDFVISKTGLVIAEENWLYLRTEIYFDWQVPQVGIAFVPIVWEDFISRAFWTFM